MTPRKNYLISAPDDGLPALGVHTWAEDKYVRSTMYAELFATGMKAKWRRVYVGICTGPGHVKIQESNRRVLASPLLALHSLPNRFDQYIFCDASQEYIDALHQRVDRDYEHADVQYVVGDVNDVVGEIVAKIPDGALTFAFIDPFQLNIGFDVGRSLSAHGRVDILFTLMLHHDANRAWSNYISDNNDKVDRFLGDNRWRVRWEAARLNNEHPVPFLAREFGERMNHLGHINLGLGGMHQVRAQKTNTPLYHMAFFSRENVAVGFWRQVLKYSSDQRELPFS